MCLFKSIGISSCGGLKQLWRNRVNCSHIYNVFCARGDRFKYVRYVLIRFGGLAGLASGQRHHVRPPLSLLQSSSEFLFTVV